MTLTDLCKEINNWFDLERKFGEFTISGGTINIDSLQTGQYFRIVGSVFNDGVHKYPATDLHDETFDGAVWAMAVPPDIMDLLDEINDWIDKYSDVIESPFQSESFGGYSYTKASGSNQSGAPGSVSWQSQFKSRLDNWRKI